MTQDCSHSSSTAGVNDAYKGKRLPRAMRIVGADVESVSKVGEVSLSEEILEENNPEKVDVTTREDREKSEDSLHRLGRGDRELPWGYIFIQHMSAEKFEKVLETRNIKGGYKPKCFIHRTTRYKRKPNGKGIMEEEKPSVSGLVFLQGETKQLKCFLINNFPQYFLVNDCSTGKPAVISDSLMRPFMRIMTEEPERVTFLRTPFVEFAKNHVKLRVLTGVLAGLEGYVVRVMRDRQIVMDFGGNAVAISNVHNEDFQIAE